MAAPRPFSPAKLEEMRRRISATKLMQRLENHALGECEMTKTQIAAAGILLRKCVPDLSSVELSGDSNNPVQIRFGWKNNSKS